MCLPLQFLSPFFRKLPLYHMGFSIHSICWQHQTAIYQCNAHERQIYISGLHLTQEKVDSLSYLHLYGYRQFSRGLVIYTFLGPHKDFSSRFCKMFDSEICTFSTGHGDREMLGCHSPPLLFYFLSKTAVWIFLNKKKFNYNTVLDL